MRNLMIPPILSGNEITVSVIMTTYNGQEYVWEQLQSLYSQTRTPDEVIISDDHSTDGTATIIENFIVKHGLSNWTLTINQVNLGWQRNFNQAIGRVTGDVIFLSDQDDIWLPDKIEVMTQVMLQNSHVQCLSGRLETIDNLGRSITECSFPAGGNSGRVQMKRFSKRFNTTILLGCTLSFRRPIAEMITNLGVTHYSHDEQVCRLATLLDGLYILDRPVIKYRLHDTNSSGVVRGSGRGSSSLDARALSIRSNLDWLDAILTRIPDGTWPESKLRVLCKTRAMQAARLTFLATKRLREFLRLMRFLPYYSGISMFLGDFAYTYGLQIHAARIHRRLRPASHTVRT